MLIVHGLVFVLATLTHAKIYIIMISSIMISSVSQQERTTGKSYKKARGGDRPG